MHVMRAQVKSSHVRISLASQPYFSACACALWRGEGLGGREGKICLVTIARFSYQMGM